MSGGGWLRDAALARAAEQAERGGRRLGLEQLVRQLALVEQPVGSRTLAVQRAQVRASSSALAATSASARSTGNSARRFGCSSPRRSRDAAAAGGQRGAEGVEAAIASASRSGATPPAAPEAPLSARRAHRRAVDGGGRLMRATQSSLPEFDPTTMKRRTNGAVVAKVSTPAEISQN